MTLLYRPEQVAEELNLPRTTIFALMRDGRLESFLVGRRRLIPREAIQQFIQRQREEQAGVSGGAR